MCNEQCELYIAHCTMYSVHYPILKYSQAPILYPMYYKYSQLPVYIQYTVYTRRRIYYCTRSPTIASLYYHR